MTRAALSLAAVLAVACQSSSREGGSSRGVSDVRHAQTLTPRQPSPPPPPPPPAQELRRLSLRERFERAAPPWEGAVAEHVRRVLAAGARAGNRADVFAKVGDSITESGSFGLDLGRGWYELGEFTDLEPVIRHFSRRSLGRDREDNSFAHASLAATAGWTASQLIEGGDRSPVERELRAIRPAWAFVMIGTNDVERTELDAFERDLRELLRRIEARGTVAIVSTIPEHRGSAEFTARSAEVDARVRAVARELALPLVDYRMVMAPLRNAGISDDNVHPTVYVDNGDTRAAVFTEAGLAAGYNTRNLLLLFALRRAMQLSG